jgi:PEP-CTERM motif
MKGFLMNCVGKTHGLGRRLFVLSFLAIGIVVFSPMANASILSFGACPPANPGDIVTPCLADGMAFGTLLASLSAPFTTFNGNSSGTLLSAVYRETGGTLDFYYQITNNTISTNCGTGGKPACDPLSRETDTDFSKFITQVAFRTDGAASGVFINGTVSPVTADRNSGSGNVIGFSFSSPEIGPGTTSNVLIISTDATTFKAGSASVLDGTGATVASFEPASAVSSVPEPATSALLGSGLLALGGLRRWIKTRRGV